MYCAFHNVREHGSGSFRCPADRSDCRAKTALGGVRSCSAEPAETADQAAKLDALDRSQAVIEFQPDGTILTANANFRPPWAYTLSEVRGQHHALFVEPGYRDSAEYGAFWDALREAVSDRRVQAARQGWSARLDPGELQPVLDRAGRVVKVVKFATDVTALKCACSTSKARSPLCTAAGGVRVRSTGTILDANQNFLDAMGYRLDEIRGRHHSLFVDPTEQAGVDYREFWARLGRGEFAGGEFRRIAKGGPRRLDPGDLQTRSSMPAAAS